MALCRNDLRINAENWPYILCDKASEIPCARPGWLKAELTLNLTVARLMARVFDFVK